MKRGGTKGAPHNSAMTEQTKALIEKYTKEHCEALMVEDPAGVDRLLALLTNPKRRRKQR